MGNIAKALSQLFDRKTQARILMLGLDAAGKTTIVYKLKLNEQINTIPTIGFNVEQVSYKNVNFQMWDVGGQEKIRRLWRYYFQGTDALIFVIDSADLERIDEAKQELHYLLKQDELKDSALLVLANKQDVAHAASVAELSEKLELFSIKTRPWYIQAACATSGDGLVEGLEWLAAQLKS